MNKNDHKIKIFENIQKTVLYVNPRPAGPLDFPPPAGGGGAFERPPHDLGSWSP